MSFILNNEIVDQFKQFVSALKNSYSSIPILNQSKKYKSKGIQNSKKKQNLEFQNRLKDTFKVPLRLQRYFLLWNVYSFSIVLKSILMIPIDVILSLFNTILLLFRYGETQRVTFFSWLIIASFYILAFFQFILFFDISYLYHSFRGQSTIKLYGLMFALQVSQKILTMIGQFLFRGVRNRLAVRYVDPMQMVPQIFSSFIYVLCHSIFIYVQFIVYIVVINNSMQNFIIFCFVINLTKMKSTAFKKFDKNSYKTQINIDAKDRLQKLTYVVLFRISQWQKPVQDFWTKMLLLFVVGSIIQYIKHGNILSMISKLDTIKDLSKDMFKYLYKDVQLDTKDKQPNPKDVDRCSIEKQRSITSGTALYIPQFLSNILNKCLDNEFTVIPYTVFLLKMIYVIIYSTEFKHQTHQFIIAYLIIVIFYILNKIIINQLRKYFNQDLGGDENQVQEKIQSPRQINKGNLVKMMADLKNKNKFFKPQQSSSIKQQQNDDEDTSNQDFEDQIKQMEKSMPKRSRQQGDILQARKPKLNSFDTRSQKVLTLKPLQSTKSDDDKNSN